jgi:hypothetical protein
VSEFYEKREIAPGITEFTNTRHDSARLLLGTPHIHIHYLMTDSEMDRDGYSRVELCCHGCGNATIVTFDAVPPDVKPPSRGLFHLRKLRDAFQERHRSCPNFVGYVLCPIDRRDVTHLDMRTGPPRQSDWFERWFVPIAQVVMLGCAVALLCALIVWAGL